VGQSCHAAAGRIGNLPHKGQEHPSIVHYRMEKAETNASCGGKNGKIDQADLLIDDDREIRPQSGST